MRRLDPRLLGSILAPGVVVVVGVVPALVEGSGLRRAASASIAIVYLAVAIGGGVAMVDAPPRRRRALLGLEAALAAALVVTSRGTAGLAVMPVVSGAAVELSLLGAGLVSAAFLALIAGLGAAAGEAPARIAEVAATDASAAAFVIAFSRLMAGERRARKDVERLAGELAQANARLREYAVAAEDLATAKERNRIAREIHDGLGHSLTVVNVHLEAARQLLPGDPARAAGHVGRAQEMTREGLADVRRSVAVLRAPEGEALPLPTAIARLSEDVAASGLATDVAVRGEPRALPPAVHAALLRAAQEGLTNASRHADASRASIEVAFEPGYATLVVRDDGVGAEDTGGGFGLVGVRERAALLGGTVEVVTEPGRGLELRVRVPT
jgi:signal transduction histidine kinase